MWIIGFQREWSGVQLLNKVDVLFGLSCNNNRNSEKSMSDRLILVCFCCSPVDVVVGAKSKVVGNVETVTIDVGTNGLEILLRGWADHLLMAKGRKRLEYKNK